MRGTLRRLKWGAAALLLSVQACSAQTPTQTAASVASADCGNPIELLSKYHARLISISREKGLIIEPYITPTTCYYVYNFQTKSLKTYYAEQGSEFIAILSNAGTNSILTLQREISAKWKSKIMSMADDGLITKIAEFNNRVFINGTLSRDGSILYLIMDEHIQSKIHINDVSGVAKIGYINLNINPSAIYEYSPTSFEKSGAIYEFNYKTLLTSMAFPIHEYRNGIPVIRTDIYKMTYSLINLHSSAIYFINSNQLLVDDQPLIRDFPKEYSGVVPMGVTSRGDILIGYSISSSGDAASNFDIYVSMLSGRPPYATLWSQKLDRTNLVAHGVGDDGQIYTINCSALNANRQCFLGTIEHSKLESSTPIQVSQPIYF